MKLPTSIAARAVALSLGLVPALSAAAAAQEAVAPNALRAPLNIVPPPMQVLLQAPAPTAAAEKLAPQAAARQMKRAVRAVAAAPGSDSGIVQVGQLGALQDAPVGLEEGYGSNLWRGARLAFIADQMQRLPSAFKLASLRDAELTLHRSAAAAPAGTVDGSSWHAARLQRFLALGDSGSVLALEELTGAARTDAYAAQALVLAHLGLGQADAACAVVPSQRDRAVWADVRNFFLKLQIICHLQGGRFDRAALAIDLNERALADDRLFRDMAFLLAAQAPLVFGTAAEAAAAREAETEPPLVLPNEMTPLQLQLLRLGGQPVPRRLLSVPAYFNAALAADAVQRMTLRLQAAQRAAVNGQISAEAFSQAAQLADLSGFPPLQSAAPEAADGAEAAPVPVAPDAVFLAQALRAVDAVPDAQPMMMAAMLRLAAARGLWRDFAVLLDDRLRDLTAVAADADAVPVLDAVSPADRTVLALSLQLVGAEEAADTLAVDQKTETAALQRLLDFGEADTQLDDLLAVLQAASAPQAALQDAAALAPGADPAAAVDANDVAALPSDIAAAQSGAVGQGEAAVQSDAGPQPEMAAEPVAPHPIADMEAYRAEWTAAGPAEKAYLQREMTVYLGLGHALPEDLQATLGLTAAAEDTGGEAERFGKLADNQWAGDLLLALVDRYAETAPDALSPDDVLLLLGSLHRAGLDAAATGIGEEILLHAALRLAAPPPAAAQ